MIKVLGRATGEAEGKSGRRWIIQWVRRRSGHAHVAETLASPSLRNGQSVRVFIISRWGSAGREFSAGQGLGNGLIFHCNMTTVSLQIWLLWSGRWRVWRYRDRWGGGLERTAVPGALWGLRCWALFRGLRRLRWHGGFRHALGSGGAGCRERWWGGRAPMRH